MKSIAIASLLICTLFAFAAANKHTPQSSTNIELDVFHGSNAWWLAIAVKNGDVDTQSVQIKDSKPSSSWESMDYADGWGYWTYSSPAGQFEFPVSILLTSENGEEVTISNTISSASVATVLTTVQYDTSSAASAPADPPTAAATSRANKHTKTPTAAPTSKHTKAPTSAPTTKATTTKAATTKHATTKPTSAPTTVHATTKPTSAPTTTKATAKPTTSGGCSGPLKLLVPLYAYPGSTWDTVAASGRVVDTVAIINPNSGPGNGPDSSYNTYMAKLHSAGVEMVGYVHTSYGARAIADVKADINVYASQFPLLVGIFLDEAATASSQISYYQQLYTYIMGMPGWKYDILNPGAVPAAGYAAIATQIVTYESSASGFASSQNPSGVSCSNKDQYAVITYSASSSSMQSVVNAAVSKGYYGWVYATDGTASGNTYGTIPSFYAAMASYVASH